VGDASVSLDPLREALLGEARQSAEDCRLRAARDARSILERAEADAWALLERARTEGEAAGELEAARERARAQSEARALVLGAKQALREQLKERALASAEELRREPRYRTLLEGLARKARAQLGEDAVLEMDAPGGGVVAQAGNRRVDYSLPVLVDRCLARIDIDLDRSER
jgi:vacuolar-type H+-ATPase subunit E/Vma4